MTISFDAARVKAAAVGYRLKEDGVLETATRWFFPVWQIGCFGVVVSKHDGSVYELGSAWSVDDWLWAYDRGLRDGSPFVVTAVRDLKEAVEALLEIRVANDRWWTRRALQNLPTSFETLPSLPQLRRLDPAPFTWHFSTPKTS
jgi:hypothetical protein